MHECRDQPVAMGMSKPHCQTVSGVFEIMLNVCSSSAAPILHFATFFDVVTELDLNVEKLRDIIEMPPPRWLQDEARRLAGP